MPRMQGRVKWFNNEKGYGFIGAGNGLEVFVHYSAIIMDGFKTLQASDLVEFEVVQGFRGPSASHVTKVGVPTNELPRFRGVVKWFKCKDEGGADSVEGSPTDCGYGFISREGGPDVFVHYSNIIMNGYKALLEGDAVEFSIVAGVHGPMAVRVVKVGEGHERMLGNESGGAFAKDLKLGMTFSEVESVLGAPQTRVDLGEKFLYRYKDMTVEFHSGKMTDVR